MAVKPWIIRIIAALPGVILLNNAVAFILTPQTVVESLGMSYLDGLGRSTQIGDMGSFFACSSLFIIYGAFRDKPQWLMAGAYLLIAAAAYRLMATLLHGADFAQTFIGVEIVIFTWLVVASRFFPQANES